MNKAALLYVADAIERRSVPGLGFYMGFFCASAIYSADVSGHAWAARTALKRCHIYGTGAMIRNLFRDFLELLCLVPLLLCIALITPRAHAAEIASPDAGWPVSGITILNVGILIGSVVILGLGASVLMAQDKRTQRRERGERE